MSWTPTWSTLKLSSYPRIAPAASHFPLAVESHLEVTRSYCIGRGGPCVGVSDLTPLSSRMPQIELKDNRGVAGKQVRLDLMPNANFTLDQAFTAVVMMRTCLCK